MPSYEEALHRRQLPDLLPGNDPTKSRYSYVASATSSGSNPSSLERAANIGVEREKYAAQEQDKVMRQQVRARGPEGSELIVVMEDSRLSRGPVGIPQDERDGRSLLEEQQLIGTESSDEMEIPETCIDIGNEGHPDGQTVLEDSHPPRQQTKKQSFPIVSNFEQDEEKIDVEQPFSKATSLAINSFQTSLERKQDDSNKHSARSSYASSDGNSFDRRSGQSESPPKHDGIWEHFDDDEFSNATGRLSRQMFRSQTVASEEPTHHDSERYQMYNVVEGIDPTFRRHAKDSEDEPKNVDEPAKAVHLIKPQRRRSTDKKKSKERKK